MRYAGHALQQFARDLLIGAGLERDMAAVVAEVLLEGDLLGHDTHGLALLASYLRELDTGTMAKSGRHRVLEQRAGSALWDGGRLPGPWLTRLAIDDAIERARKCGTGTVVTVAAITSPPGCYLMRALSAVSSDASCSIRTRQASRPTRNAGVFTPNPIAPAFRPQAIRC